MSHAILPRALLIAACTLGAASASASETLNFFNWADYAGKNTVSGFERETGIKVRYDPFDSEETLQAKMLVGHSAYDVVVPSSGFLRNQLQAGLYQKLDKSRLPNWKNLDPQLMQKLESVDPGNQYAIPWTWGTTGLAINSKARQLLGPGAPLDSWAMLLNPQYLSRLQSCGVGMLDSPADIAAIALRYLHKDINKASSKDLQEAFELLKGIRPYITQFNSNSYVSDLALGDLCLAVGWSGDVQQARLQARSSKKPFQIDYIIPKEGSAIWFDVMAIPKDAPNLNAAYKWLNYIEKPDVHADISNSTFYLSANKPANALVKSEIRDDPVVNPDSATLQRLTAVQGLPPELMRQLNRLWANFKTGR
ncbi:polyamine ABC transporter substrate-binding protein [Aquitalea aquatilis]|uniref:polyamine ABC transporter substrate-binding protein n=1 Tax=Aquitalea aquatilis TaxID=1537400 RepID=UPI0010BE049D|nr:polyamine ABC transporter substrate-binding protein [Aquitalea aquatilis]